MIGKFCLTSTASFQQINHAPTNRSTTKQTFSFNKTNRFQDPKPECPLNTYDSNILNRKASGNKMGLGSRSDFTKCLTVSPSSSKYKLKSFWDENVSKKKGYGFGLSRERVSFSNYIPKEPLAVPSSTVYNNEKPNKLNSPKYTLRTKTSILDKKMTIEAQNTNPGPGTYINPETEGNSKFQKISYQQAKSQRFNSSQTITPGPGKYKEINSLNKVGNYVLSNAKGGTQAKFDQLKRQTLFDKVFKKQLDCPGPGYYQAPSEFGQYDGDIYRDMRASKKGNVIGWVQSQRKIKK